MKYLEIRLIKGLPRVPNKLRLVVKGLGLGKVNSHVIRKNDPCIRGMVKKVIHLVDVKEVSHES